MSLERRALLGRVILGLAAAGLPSLAAAQPYPAYPPPPPPLRPERVPGRPPRGDLVWQPGHWQWNGRSYVWVPGQWVVRRRRGRWRPGRWVRRGGGYVWVPGGWY